MANVTCPKCGTEFDSKEKRCPACGEKNRLKICYACGSQMAKGAKRCPKCGAKSRKPIYQRVWFWILVLFLIFRISRLFEPDNQVDTGNNSEVIEQQVSPTPEPTLAATPEPTPVGDALELVGGIEGTEGIYDSRVGSIHITGQVKNNSGKTLSYVNIQFSLYDVNGNVVGTARDNVTNLAAGETWSFDALGLSDIEVDSYKATELTARAYNW